jgi:hypothetical protein
MRRSLRVFLVLILLLGPAFLNSVAQDQKKPEPLTEGEIIRLLLGGVPPERVEGLARDRGITFEVTPAVERDLTGAGGTDHLVRTLRELTPSPGKAEPKKETPKTETPQAGGTLLIAVDAASKVTLDGDEVGEFSPDTPKRIAASLGEHLVQATSKEEPAAQVQWTGKVEKAEQAVVLLKLADKVASVKKTREQGEQEAAEKEKLKPLLGSWTNYYHELRPRNAPCVSEDTSSQTFEFRPEGFHGPHLEGKGTYHEMYVARTRPPCTGGVTDYKFTYDLTVSCQADEGIYKYRQTVTACSGACGRVTVGESTEGTFRLESPTKLVDEPQRGGSTVFLKGGE